MWRTDTFWFDVAIILSMLTFGNILLGHFEEHRPKWRRVLKTILMLALFLTISATAGRAWALAALVLPLIAVLWIHLVYLPRHGVNGWTGEPNAETQEMLCKSATVNCEYQNLVFSILSAALALYNKFIETAQARI